MALTHARHEGNLFSATTVTDDTEGRGHFRISFSNAEASVFVCAYLLI